MVYLIYECQLYNRKLVKFLEGKCIRLYKYNNCIIAHNRTFPSI
jgi:hypothetical protein